MICVREPKLKKEARLFRVAGRVQGVGFRFFVKHVAGELGVDGWVRNREDGSVEVYAECTSAKMEELRAALRRGPASGRVEELSETPTALLGRRGFTIEASH